jgi:hypothetical protein
MEISPLTACRISIGCRTVIQLIESWAPVVSSGPLVTQFASLWNRSETEGHLRGRALAWCPGRAHRTREAGQITESAAAAVVDAIRGGLEFDNRPIVGSGLTPIPHEPIPGATGS